MTSSKIWMTRKTVARTSLHPGRPDDAHPDTGHKYGQDEISDLKVGLGRGAANPIT